MTSKYLMYRRMMKACVCTGLLLAASTVFAGTVGKISGSVKEAGTGEPVIGAAVMIEGTSMGASADLEGEYFILNVPPGTVTLRVTALGYAPKAVQNVQIISDQTTRVDFDLRQEALKGEEVVIVAEERLVELDRTFATATISSDNIDVLPVTNLDQVIEIQAGVVDGHFRGGRDNEVAYLVDGVSITDAYDNAQGTAVDESIVQELQVISGTFNAEHGQALSGIVNIVTKEGASELGGSFTAEAGDYLSDHNDIFVNVDDVTPSAIQDYSASLYGPVPKVPKLSFYLSGRYLTDEGWQFGQRRFGLSHPVIATESGVEIIPVFGDSSYVPMNPNMEAYGHGKLTYELTDRIKLNYTSLFSHRIYRDYDHQYKWIPDGDLRRYRDGRTNLLKLNHTLTGSMFYEVALTNSFTEYHHYTFEDPYDPRYVHPQYLEYNPAYTLNVSGTNLNRFRRWTNTNQAMGNFSWQATKLHLFKFGFDVKLHEVFYEDINLVPENPSQIFNPSGEVGPLVFDPFIDDVTTTSHDRYKTNPYEYAVYVQDKFELKSLIVNAGLRFDYFEPDGKILADPKDPNIYNPLLPSHDSLSLAEREAIWWKDATAKYRLSPRLGIAYPMSDKGVFHFAYGHFVQRSTFERMYTNPEWELEPGVGLNTVMGNPDLKMEETVTYEFGFQQEVAENIALNTTLYYRDIRNLVATDKIVETYSAGTRYSQYINRSFGEVKGVTLSFDKRFVDNFSAFVDYTYQVAKGDASDPQSAYNDLRGSNPREPIRQLVPLNWDRRHTLNASLTYATTSISNWGATLLAKYGSGLPYSPENQGIRTGFENDGRRPDFYNLDLSAFKTFTLGPDAQYKLVLTLTVLNLLDTENEDNVYADTGRAGYSQEENRAHEVSGINTLEEYYTNPTYYSRPRMVKVGLKYEF